MGTIKVTVINQFLPHNPEEFICSNVDISDLQEMEYAAEECVGAYVDMYSEQIEKMNFDKNIAEYCEYLIEVINDDNA